MMKQVFGKLTAACLVAVLVYACQPKSPEQVKVKIQQEGFVYEQADFPQCHASTLAETDSGLLIAFFGGEYERHPNVAIYTSRLESESWSEPQKVADGWVSDSLSYPCWNPVFFQIDKRLYLYYKVGPSPTEWWGMQMYSEDGGQSWSEPSRLPDGILGPIKNKPVELASGVILSPSSVEVTHELWKAHIERSTDRGASWQKIEIPSPDSVKVIQPSLLVYPDGRIQALLRSNQDVLMESWSTDEGQSWSPVQASSVLNPNSGVDAVTLRSGLKLLVNNPMKSGDSWEVGRNRLFLYASYDGENWAEILQLENEAEGEFSYPAIIQSEDGVVHISYTYNRRKMKHVALTVE